MTEGPYPQVPSTTGPVSGIPALGHIGAQPRRTPQQRPLAKDKANPDNEADAPKTGSMAVAPVEPDPLIEALDRLRATDVERSAEDMVIRLVKARRVYHVDQPETPAGDEL